MGKVKQSRPSKNCLIFITKFVHELQMREIANDNVDTVIFNQILKNTIFNIKLCN